MVGTDAQERALAKVLFTYRPPAGLPGAVVPPPTPVRRAPEEPSDAKDGASDRWWYESSYDLRSGLEVSDEESDTVPGELIDQLFKP